MAPGLSFSLLRPSAGFDPFSLALLRTISGKPISLRELALVCDETGGLVYGMTPEVPADLEGLDGDRILELDAATERTLISMLGEAGYVRVDARDVLARPTSPAPTRSSSRSTAGRPSVISSGTCVASSRAAAPSRSSGSG